ncbi:uncharacterized protein [Triticum aestivum]|uniref:uncharacterized protein n=1 Tax=Triticum aestivum TaxID=4565 RepID=UPI001D010B5F|nr:uncharacterized protein LOC123120274 [Triticum aestivum]
MAARAHDAAVLAFSGHAACLNFADSAWRMLPVLAAGSFGFDSAREIYVARILGYVPVAVAVVALQQKQVLVAVAVVALQQLQVLVAVAVVALQQQQIPVAVAVVALQKQQVPVAAAIVALQQKQVPVAVGVVAVQQLQVPVAVAVVALQQQQIILLVACLVPGFYMSSGSLLELDEEQWFDDMVAGSYCASLAQGKLAAARRRRAGAAGRRREGAEIYPPARLGRVYLLLRCRSE